MIKEDENGDKGKVEDGARDDGDGSQHQNTQGMLNRSIKTYKRNK